jgi:uncharacterized protein (UPF0548 family)
MHSGAGLTVTVTGPAAIGRTVVLGLGRPIGLVLPCRVVWTVDEERRRGFAYGTSPGHPECGEESFVIERDDQDGIWLSITAFSKPAAAVLRCTGPANRASQAFFLRRYANALAQATDPPSATSGRGTRKS